MTMELASGALAEVLPPPSGMPNETYTPERLAAVMWRVASGETAKGACAAEGFHFTTLYYWLLRAPELERMWRAARRLGAQSLFDEALEQVRKLVTHGKGMSGAEVRALDVAQSALRGMSEVMNPSEFSNRQVVNPPVMVKIITTLNLNPGSDLALHREADVYTLPVQVMEDRALEPEDGIVPGAPKLPPGTPSRRRSTSKMVTGKEVGDDPEGV